MKTNMLKKVALVSLSVSAAITVSACSKEENVVFHNVKSGLTAGVANSRVDHSDATIAERTQATLALEKYTMENMLGGIPLFENAQFQRYNPSVFIPTKDKEYIPSFGFGVLSNGEITEPLAAEPTTAWKKYYHQYQSLDFKTINYWNDANSTTSTLSSHIHMPYYSSVLNEDKDGFEYAPFSALSEVELLNADGTPIANQDENTKSSKFRFEVRVGADLKYSTMTQNSILKRFNNQEVALEDYLTGYKELHNQSNSLYRGPQGIDSSTAIKGLRGYYDATKEGFNQDAWDNVGVKTKVENSKSYIEIELNSPVTRFFAKYYTSSSLFTPIPSAFIENVGGMKFYGTFGSTNQLTPVDTTLATGPYMVEEYVGDSHIVFKENPNFPNNTDSTSPINAYKTSEGVHYNILKAAQTDSEAAWKEFELGKLHSVPVPTTKIADWDDTKPNVYRAMGSVTYKLNINGCDEQQWEELFGTNGTQKQTPLSNYWEVEPALSNNDFLQGLYFSIKREEYAKLLGQAPSGQIFGDAYLSDPEASKSYNTTTPGRPEALANWLTKDSTGKNTYGYDSAKAQVYFMNAYEALITQGHYKQGDTINLELSFSSTSTTTNYGNPLKQYFEEAANFTGAKLKLNVVLHTNPSSSTYTSDKVTSGQSDLTFGAISGSTFSPIEYFDIYCSDNRSGFLRNWGFDTSKNDGTLEFDGEKLSFDALWGAFNTPGGVDVLNGEVKPVDFEAVIKSSLHDDEKNERTLVVSAASGANVVITTVKLKGNKDGKSVEIDLTANYNSTTNELTYTLDESQKDHFKGTVTIEFTYTLNGETKTYSVKTHFVK